MTSVQESTNELNAAIRYAENAITSAKQTIESMQFRQDMAKKQYTEQTGREESLTKKLAFMTEKYDRMKGYADKLLHEQGTMEAELEERISEVADLKVQIEGHRTNMALLTDELEKPTMPVIPKDVAIAIFREGVAHGVSNACDELDNSDSIEISETGYTGDFEVSFSKYVDLSDHLDLDWLRSEVGVNDEADVIEALKGLCADKEFECRIHGIDDNPTNND